MSSIYFTYVSKDRQLLWERSHLISRYKHDLKIVCYVYAAFCSLHHPCMCLCVLCVVFLYNSCIVFYECIWIDNLLFPFWLKLGLRVWGVFLVWGFFWRVLLSFIFYDYTYLYPLPKIFPFLNFFIFRKLLCMLQRISCSLLFVFLVWLWYPLL